LVFATPDAAQKRVPVPARSEWRERYGFEYLVERAAQPAHALPASAKLAARDGQRTPNDEGLAEQMRCLVDKAYPEVA